MLPKKKAKGGGKLKEILFPSFAPLPMKIMFVIAVLVLLSTGVLFAAGYFDDTSEEQVSDETAPPAAVTATSEPTPSAGETQTPQPTVEATESPEAVELHFESGDGTVYNNDDELFLYVGDTISFCVIVDGTAAVDSEITWKSFDGAVLSADNGVLTALTAGTTKCRATYSGSNQSISLNVTVLSAVINAEPAVTQPITAEPSVTPSDVQATVPPEMTTEPPAESTPEPITPVEPGNDLEAEVPTDGAQDETQE